MGDWRASRHAPAGVGCLDCHSGEGKDRPDVEEHNGYHIVVAVTPKDCARCHEREAKEFLGSRHAQGAQFIGSLDNFLGEIVGGPQAVDVGCRQCHGSTLKAAADGRLDSATWPNTGIGRVNLDGSSGSCSACHARHRFSVAQARQPDNCGKCHLGPDHPQLEIYEESKHGILFDANRQTMNLDRLPGDWRPGKDYLYPTCASCHMDATSSQPVTHDVGERISWTLRPPISTKLANADARKQAMLTVCQSCHSPGFANSFYHQYESLVMLYNDKFAAPAKQLMDQLQADHLITPTPFDDKIEWTYYLLWHHEGRRARHGAAMAGPDYAWWHGLFEVADCFYNEFLPEAEALKPGISDPVLASDYHRWRKGLSKDEVQQILDFYRQRYQQSP
ncbi:MAG: multiheme c-type cytochrome [Armatimonadota bacterium]